MLFFFSPKLRPGGGGLQSETLKNPGVKGFVLVLVHTVHLSLRVFEV